MHHMAVSETGSRGILLVIFASGSRNRHVELACVPSVETTELERIQELEVELSTSKQRVQAIIEEYETSQEETRRLKRGDAVGERGTPLDDAIVGNLQRRAAEHQRRASDSQSGKPAQSGELAQLTSDLQNLLSAPDIATLFLDRELRILRSRRNSVSYSTFVSQIAAGPSLTCTTAWLWGTSSDALSLLGRLISIEREEKDEADHRYLHSYSRTQYETVLKGLSSPSSISPNAEARKKRCAQVKKAPSNGEC